MKERCRPKMEADVEARFGARQRTQNERNHFKVYINGTFGNELDAFHSICTGELQQRLS